MLCSYIGCNRKILMIVGHCHYCQQHFCSTHRLPEDHQCVELTKYRQILFERNKAKLMDEQITPQKI